MLTEKFNFNDIDDDESSLIINSIKNIVGVVNNDDILQYLHFNYNIHNLGGLGKSKIYPAYVDNCRVYTWDIPMEKNNPIDDNGKLQILTSEKQYLLFTVHRLKSMGCIYYPDSDDITLFGGNQNNELKENLKLLGIQLINHFQQQCHKIIKNISLTFYITNDNNVILIKQQSIHFCDGDIIFAFPFIKVFNPSINYNNVNEAFDFNSVEDDTDGACSILLQYPKILSDPLAIQKIIKKKYHPLGTLNFMLPQLLNTSFGAVYAANKKFNIPNNKQDIAPYKYRRKLSLIGCTHIDFYRPKNYNDILNTIFQEIFNKSLNELIDYIDDIYVTPDDGIFFIFFSKIYGNFICFNPDKIINYIQLYQTINQSNNFLKN